MSRSICGTCYCVIDDDTGECGCIYPDTASPQPAAQPESICRTDGRCQYAIDHGAEGLGHCPKGRCAMPVQPEPGALTDDAVFAKMTLLDPGWNAYGKSRESAVRLAIRAVEREVLSTRKLSDEQVARLFHDTYERLAPSFGYETRADTRQFDPASPNGKLMIAVCAEVERLLRGEA